MIRHAAQVIAVCLLVIVVIFGWAEFSAWSQAFFGFRNGGGNGSHYLFWSGAGGVLLGNVLQPALIAGVFVYFRKNNCKMAWCPRIGHHEFTDPSDGVSRLLCWRHHPDVKHRALNAVVVERIHARQRARR